jgi:PhnB protein
MTVNPIPEGFHSLTPFFNVKDAARFIDFLKAAFAAEETFRMERPDGAIGHASLRIGDSMLMLSEPTDNGTAEALGIDPQLRHDDPTVSCIYLYVPDVDAVYASAVAAGARSLEAPTDQFWGDRSSTVEDAWGNRWFIATQREQLTEQDVKARAQEGMAGS